METFTVSTPLGGLLGEIEDGKLTGLRFADPVAAAASGGKHPLAAITRNWIADYFSGNYRSYPKELLNPRGTVFQKQIWENLLEINPGQTVSYGQATRQYLLRSGRESMCPRAVASAIARNPIIIIIPCHRVIRGDGGLGGYSGGEGVKTKKALLALERKWSGKQIFP